MNGSNNDSGRKKISFATTGGFDNKKVNFSKVKTTFDTANIEQNSKPVNQFRKPNFGSFLNNNNKDDGSSSNEPVKEQFRKTTFNYEKRDNENSNNRYGNNGYYGSRDNGGQQRSDGFQNNRKPNGNNSGFRQNRNGASGFVKSNGENRQQNGSFGGNSYGNGFKKPFSGGNFQNGNKFSTGNKFSGNKQNNFFKKSNQVKVKLNIDKNKNNDNNVFRKTANTGQTVDKYSINSMLKGLSNSIDLDTEIDDVLGNVINVKLAGINSANSFQHERKVRTSSGDKPKQVNFNVPITRNIEIYNNEITLANLADQMSVSVKELVKILKQNGIEFEDYDIKTIGDEVVDGDTAELVAESCGHTAIRIADDDAENEFISQIKKDRKDIRPRAPIVTIMGHVDHGKTTLLDTIRKASVVAGEAGGITQHIGAYRTKVGNRWITFLDTPGHAAFTQMRMRGAQATDIAVIVIAGDDGIMPQTIEAINHAKVAGVPIIVAINKIDKPEANVERAKQMLLQYEVIPEDLGGDVMVVPISAKEGKNIDKLLDAILLQADILELKAYYDGGVDGIVVESKLDKKRGALVTVIVKNGVLSQGDFIVAGEQYGKIRGMFDENGQLQKTAEPSVPVEILGLNATPNAGEIFYAVKNEKSAKEMVEYRQEKAKQDAQNSKVGLTADDVFAKMKADNNVKKVSFIIKADTKGSLEAIVNTLEKLENNEVKLQIAHTGVGSVSENDILLASTCGAVIMTFNTQKCDKNVIAEAEKKDIEIRDYKIIYELFDDAKDILSGKLKPVVKKNILGQAEVKAIFEISKVGKIAGCMVKDGVISRGANISVIRNGESVFETKCISLKHGKENVKDVQNGQECGIGIEKIEDIIVGDILEFFTLKEEKKSF